MKNNFHIAKPYTKSNNRPVKQVMAKCGDVTMFFQTV